MKISNLFKLLAEREISTKKLSDDTGISTGNISDWKSGRSQPSINALITIADYLNISLDYLVGRTEEQTIGYERVSCDNCNESVIFHFKDSNQNDYALGLSTILGCITFAIQCGDLPKLPMSWLADADSICGTEYANDNRNCYSDYGKEKNKCEKDK